MPKKITEFFRRSPKTIETNPENFYQSWSERIVTALARCVRDNPGILGQQRLEGTPECTRLEDYIYSIFWDGVYIEIDYSRGEARCSVRISPTRGKLPPSARQVKTWLLCRDMETFIPGPWDETIEETTVLLEKQVVQGLAREKEAKAKELTALAELIAKTTEAWNILPK